MSDKRIASTSIQLGLIAAMLGLLVACGGSGAATQAPPDDGGGAIATPDDGGGGDGGEDPAGGESVDPGAFGGDAGNRSKGSVQAQISGGYTGSVDLPFVSELALFNPDGSGGAYMVFTDPGSTMYLTLDGNGDLLIQYVHPDASLTASATPCKADIEAVDDNQAKGTFDCKSLTLLQGEQVGTADITGSFEAHR